MLYPRLGGEEIAEQEQVDKAQSRTALRCVVISRKPQTRLGEVHVVAKNTETRRLPGMPLQPDDLSYLVGGSASGAHGKRVSEIVPPILLS